MGEREDFLGGEESAPQAEAEGTLWEAALFGEVCIEPVYEHMLYLQT